MTRNLFDEGFGGDFRLRACGGEELWVHQNIMSIASPVFEGMFTVPQPQAQDEHSDKLSEEPTRKKAVSNVPVVDLTEDAETINALLRCIYPVDKPIINNVVLAVKVVKAAEKYIMPPSCLYPIYIYLLRAGEDDLDHPDKDDIDLRFALAWRLGYKQIASEASHGILCGSTGFQNLQAIVELSGDKHIEATLVSAKLARSEAMERLSSIICLRVGGLLCVLCSQSPSKPVFLAAKAITGLKGVLVQDWRERRAVLVDESQLVRCVNQAVERAMGQVTCARCNKPTPMSYTGLSAAHEIPNAIGWPSNKPDSTPGLHKSPGRST